MTTNQFIMEWSKLIHNITDSNNSEQHSSAQLCVTFPPVMFQAHKSKDLNYPYNVSKRLKLNQEENYSELTNITRPNVIENTKGKAKSKVTKAKLKETQ